MYYPTLATFITVADCGSFTKAAESLYLSPTAVMKQMNTLEKHLGFQLIERAKTGVRLTAAGKIIYRDARLMIAQSEKTLAEARAATYTYETTFCVGTSLLNPAKPFMDLWYEVNRDFPDYKLHLVPFEDNHEGIVSEIEKLGQKFDFLIGVCDSKTWLSLCRFLPLGRYKKMVAVSRTHPLARKTCIEPEELHGETLMLVRRGDSEVNDLIRSDLEKNHPQIRLEDTPSFYDLSVFNRCAETNNVLLTIECWKDVHPGLVSIPVNWDYSIPYGLLYSLDAPDDVLRLVRTLQQFNSRTKCSPAHPAR